MKKINILILGMGGNVSQGILKAIKKSKINCKIIGACISEESFGLFFCDDAYISPYSNSDEFIPWLIDICNKEKIDIVNIVYIVCVCFWNYSVITPVLSEDKVIWFKFI